MVVLAAVAVFVTYALVDEVMEVKVKSKAGKTNKRVEEVMLNGTWVKVMHKKEVELGVQDAMMWGPDVHHGAWGGMAA
jgi:hypothetical protein